MSKIKISKTHYWKTENGRVINLDDLPGSVKQHIEIFDAIRKDLTDIKYQEQVYSLALATKKQQIEQIIAAMINAHTKQEEQTRNVDINGNFSGSDEQ